jgi:hypothetical protein
MRPDLNRSIRSFFDPRGEDIAHRLRELPGEADVPYDWAEFRRRERTRYWRPRQAVKWQHAATAAGVTVFIAVMAMWGRSVHPPEDVRISEASTSPSLEQPASGSTGNEAPANATHEIVGQVAAITLEASILAAQRAARERAQASQQWLARQPDEPALIRVGPRLAVANLEDRIAWLDDALTDEQFGRVDAQQVAALQQERARLVNSLAQVRYAETLAAVN